MGNKIKEFMQRAAQIRARCMNTLGPDITEFLCSTLQNQNWMDEARHTWKESYGKNYNKQLLEMAEDEFLTYLTSTQLMALRHLMDNRMLPNHVRRGHFPFVMMALMGCTFEQSLETLSDAGSATMVSLALLFPEVPQSSAN